MKMTTCDECDGAWREDFRYSSLMPDTTIIVEKGIRVRTEGAADEATLKDAISGIYEMLTEDGVAESKGTCCCCSCCSCGS